MLAFKWSSAPDRSFHPVVGGGAVIGSNLGLRWWWGWLDFIYLFKRFLPLPKKYVHFSSHETITWYLRRSRQAESRTEPVPPLENTPMVKNNARVTLCIWNIWDECSTVALKPSSMDPWVEYFCLFVFPSEFSYYPVSSHNACSDYLEALWIYEYLDKQQRVDFCLHSPYFKKQLWRK